MSIQHKNYILMTLVLLSSMSLSEIISMDIEDLPRFLFQEEKSDKMTRNKTNKTNAPGNLDNSFELLFGTERELVDSGTEPIIDPLDENNEDVTTTAPVEENNTESPTTDTTTPAPVENKTTEEVENVNSIGFQNRPNSGEKKPLWPALCETKYHGTQWGKSDGEYSYFTLGSKSYLCPEHNKRDDLNRLDFDPENKVSPCPQLIAEDSRGLKWAPVIVRTTYGEIPGKVFYFDDSKKTRSTGVFSYMGRSYRGPIMSWIC